MVLFFTDLAIDVGDIWVPVYDFSQHHWFTHGFGYLLSQGTSFSLPVLSSFHFSVTIAQLLDFMVGRLVILERTLL
jgi:hypothetical protein